MQSYVETFDENITTPHPIGSVLTSTDTENVITQQPNIQRQLASSHIHRQGPKTAGKVKVQPMPNFDDNTTPTKRLTGLASLAVCNSILIQVSPSCFSCDWDKRYDVWDDGTESILMFSAIEELQCCSCGSLQNIVIRDPEDNPVARVCYKEKSCLSGKLALAVYAPPDLLLGTAEEFSQFGFGCWSSKFVLRNSETDNLFVVDYHPNACPGADGHFVVQTNDGNSESARITTKSSSEMKLHFATKTNVTVKMILVGFCLGILHKSYKQEFVEPSEAPSE